MVYLELFWLFLKIGLFTIGGGYAMLPMIRNEVVLLRGWMTETELLDFIGIAESTPGPFVANMATFVGNAQGGVLGAICATIGLILPSLIVIMLIAAVFEKLVQTKAVQGFLYGVRPVVAGLIASTAAVVFLGVVMPAVKLTDLSHSDFSVDYVSLALVALFFGISRIKIKNKKGEKKSLHPILLISISAVCGILLFVIIGI